MSTKDREELVGVTEGAVTRGNGVIGKTEKKCRRETFQVERKLQRAQRRWGG